MIDLVALHDKVWAFRSEMSLYWPTPDPLSAMQFAFIEISEAMDAFLRLKNLPKGGLRQPPPAKAGSLSLAP